MYRSGWGTKEGQEVILAVRLKRSAFDEILAAAVSSTFVPEVYASEKEWKQAAKSSSVRLQWDQDRHPNGTKLERKAIQLGLRSEMLQQYAQNWIVNIEDISQFVQQQRQNLKQGMADLLTPSGAVYPVTNSDTAQRLQLSVT